MVMLSPVIGSIVQTSTLGNVDGGVAFNDLETLRIKSNHPVSLVVNPDRPIAKITVRADWLIDGIDIVYNLARSGTYEIKHGKDGGTSTVIEVGRTQVVSSISGLIGPHRDYENKIFLNQITITLLDVDSGITTVHSFGNRPQGSSFLFTMPALVTGSVGQAGDGTTGICAFGSIKRGEL